MKRCGYSLIEALTVISISSLIFSGVAMALHAMYRADSVARKEMESSVNLDRLANRFRADVHAATGAQTKEGSIVLQLEDSRSIAYEAGPKRVQRVVRSGDNVEHRDSFRLAEADVKWEREGESPTVSLIVERSAGMPSRVDARVGSDRRFQRSAAP